MSNKSFAEIIERNDFRRRFVDRTMSTLLAIATALALIPLFSIFIYIAYQGFDAINWDFFTQTPKPVGELGGGMANALAGTMFLAGIASLFGVPWGIGVGLYLSEYGEGLQAKIVRFCTDLLSSVPSIIIGLFIYELVVQPTKHFSALAGGISLALIMIPIIARTTEELLRMVPTHVREAGLALGLPRWRVILLIVLRGSRKGIATALMLALARISGETAPLLFTAFNNQFWSLKLDEPISSLPVQIYTYAISPFEDWQRQAWAGALVLVLFVFTVNGLTRFMLRSSSKGNTL
jgi:phosphate transport system permease protein